MRQIYMEVTIQKRNIKIVGTCTAKVFGWVFLLSNVYKLNGTRQRASAKLRQRKEISYCQIESAMTERK